MAVRMLVTRTISLKTRQLFVLSGFILEGTVTRGMYIKIPQISKPLIVKGVEFVDYLDEKRGEVGLTIECLNQKELDFLSKSDIAGKEIQLTLNQPLTS